MNLLNEKDGTDTELLVYSMTLINKVKKSFRVLISPLKFILKKIKGSK